MSSQAIFAARDNGAFMLSKIDIFC
jgi:hypothetical protein